MTPESVKRALQWRMQVYQRRLLARAANKPLERTEIELLSTAGYKLSARITRPAGAAAQHAIVVSPGIHQGREAVEGYAAVVNADEIARLGYTVLTFDPAGRGKSWGDEDYGGPEHQDDLRVAVKHLLASPQCDGRVGVLSLSLGIAASVGALVAWPQELPVRWLLDWEGPCDREIITSGGTILVPAAGHSLEDDTYWIPREATRGIGRLRCGYVRLQALPDHAQPTEIRHAQRMIHAAAAGTLPWFQLNDHPRGEAPARPDWLKGGPWAANQAILRKLKALKNAPRASS